MAILFETLHRQIEEYADEPWKGAHDAAMLCCDVEGAIRAVVWLFDAVNRIDSQLMLATMPGRLKHDPKVTPKVRRCHRGFLETAEGLKREIAELRASGSPPVATALLQTRPSKRNAPAAN